jgi:hypothetical protein
LKPRPLPVGLHVRYAGGDSNSHCTRSKRVASCLLGYRRMVLQWRSDLPKPYPAAERLQQNGAPCTGSNLRPAAYKAAALPTELTEHGPGTDCSGHTTRAPGQCRQKQDKRPRHRTARCRWPVLDVHDVKQQSSITHACTHADAFAARAVADAAARTRLTKSIVWMLRVWFGPSLPSRLLAEGFFRPCRRLVRFS